MRRPAASFTNSTSPAKYPASRSQVVNNNRRQALLFAALTVLLTVATGWGGRVLAKLRNLTFAVVLDHGFASGIAVIGL